MENVLVGGGGASSRMSAKAAIEWRVEHLRRQADKLEQLARAADQLPPDAEEALWRLLMDQR